MDDFKSDVQKYIDNFGEYCLTVNGDAITTTPITPVGGCSSPQYANDDFCDDDNNKPECDYDGGDCCPPTNNTLPAWDDYCSTCQCIMSKFCF